MPRDHYTPTVYFRAWATKHSDGGETIWREPAGHGEGRKVAVQRVGWKEGWSTIRGLRSRKTGQNIERTLEKWLRSTENFWPEVRKSLFPESRRDANPSNLDQTKRLRKEAATAFARASMMTPEGLKTVRRRIQEIGEETAARCISEYTNESVERITEGLEKCEEMTLKQAAVGLLPEHKRSLWAGEWWLLFSNAGQDSPIFGTTDNAFAWTKERTFERWMFPLTPWHVMTIQTSEETNCRARSTETGHEIELKLYPVEADEKDIVRLNKTVAEQAGRWRVQKRT